MRLRERLRAALPLGPRMLVVTAVAAERSAVRHGLGRGEDASGPRDPIVVEAVGVGSGTAAAVTARRLALAETQGAPFAIVVCAGIAGGFVGRAELGQVVLASRSVAADLGAESPQGYLSITDLGYGPSTVEVDTELLAVLSVALPAAAVGEILTVNTVTGTAGRSAELAARFPDALAEAMEGYGVAVAAEQAGAAFVEVRAVANPIGPRDRDAWRIDDALTSLAAAAAALAEVLIAAPAD